MKKLIIFGARQIAEICAFYFEHDSGYEVEAFTVDGKFVESDKFSGKPVIPFEEVARRFVPDQHDIFIAVGYSDLNRMRARKLEAAKALGYRVASYLCSKAMSWPNLELGENSFVMEGNVIQPFASIGANTILWSGNHIGHHARIGNHCFLASHIVVSGNVSVGDNCFIGVNATLRDGINIAQDCLIGAGTVIMRDTKAGEVYAVAATPASKAPSSRVSP